MTLNEYQKQLLDLLEEATNAFQGELPFVENEIYRRVQLLVKDIEIKNGVILNTTANLKTIGKINAEINAAVLSPKYLAAVQNFVNAYNKVAELQKKYFKANFDERLPEAKLAEYQKQAKDAVVAKLTGAGIEANIVEQLQDVLRRNITTGGSFQDLNFQIQEFIISSDQNINKFGKLNAYATTLTTDALNQFSAQYHDIVSADLGLQWRMYVGSNIATTREFCEYLTKKKYVHISEIPEILQGHIDGHNVKMNPKTDLWYGAIEGTNASNFKINRGGYRCGHQFIAVADVIVPKEIRESLGKEKSAVYKSNFIKDVKPRVMISKTQVKNLKDLGATKDDIISLGGGWPSSKKMAPIKITITDDGNDDFVIRTYSKNNYTSTIKVDFVYKNINNQYILAQGFDDDPGVGFRFLLNQIQAARKLGFESIEIHAVSGGQLKGAHTWGKFGVVMRPQWQHEFEELMKAHGRTEKDIFELQSTKDGREFWNNYGVDDWYGFFDLNDGSESMGKFMQYAKDKGFSIEL